MTSKESPSVTHPEELQGWAVDSTDRDKLRHAIELAFNYRGDVTITRRSPGAPIEGYIFDLKPSKVAGEIIIRMIPKNTDDRIEIPLSDIAQLGFSGRDTASGKSFETWVRKYAEKKLAGEKASIESESLEHE